MNQYPAPMPGHFMWHLFSIPFWAQRAGWVPPHHSQSLWSSTEVCNLHWPSSYLSLAEHASVLLFWEFGSIFVVTGAEQGHKKATICSCFTETLLFNQPPQTAVTVSSAVFLHHLSARLNVSLLVSWRQFYLPPSLLYAFLDIPIPEGSH